ncbi:FAD-dependent monooxygenase [Colwelliaceae bacterium 6441]
MDKFDCVVIGGGMVGAASALSLAQLGLTVGIVECIAPKAFHQEQAFDLRVSAISLGSQFLLEQLDAWQQIKDWRLCPYRRLAVWELEQAYTEFSAEEISQSHLGHIIENRVIQLALWQQIKKHKQIKLFCPESLVGFEQQTDQVIVQLSEHTVSSKLLIAADGANSQVRNIANIGTTGWDYQQSAMLINVQTTLAQQDITWQHFRSTGPVAMLPMPGHHASLVWYHKKDEITRLCGLSNSQLKQRIEQEFPEKLGEVNVIDKASFPLTRRHANQYQNNRVLLLGDAAHTINPLAGQGVNLGFKDVKALQEVIAKAIGDGQCWHDVNVLSGYEKIRRKDNLLMMSAMDMLYSGFSHPSGLAKAFRNGGLFMANQLPKLKSKALAYACGL